MLVVMTSQGAHPACLFLTITLLVTAGATVILLTAILTDHWEEITYNRRHVESITTIRNQTHFLTWLISGKVAKIDILLIPHAQEVGFETKRLTEATLSTMSPTTMISVFLVPLNGGIWTLCVSLSGMQNLSISCSLVCCILLGASAIVGSVGIVQRQISAVLITGVMYILSTTFGMFSLSIMQYKRKTQKDCGILDSQITPEFIAAREFYTGWSLELGWGGAVGCLCSSLLWLLLAKFMRYNPISLS